MASLNPFFRKIERTLAINKFNVQSQEASLFPLPALALSEVEVSRQSGEKNCLIMLFRLARNFILPSIQPPN